MDNKAREEVGLIRDKAIRKMENVLKEHIGTILFYKLDIGYLQAIIADACYQSVDVGTAAEVRKGLQEAKVKVTDILEASLNKDEPKDSSFEPHDDAEVERLKLRRCDYRCSSCFEMAHADEESLINAEEEE